MPSEKEPKESIADVLAALAKRAPLEVSDPEKLRLVQRYLRLAGESL